MPLCLSRCAQPVSLKLEINVFDGLSLTFIFIIPMLSTLNQLSDNEVHVRKASGLLYIKQSNFCAKLVLLTLCLL